MSTINKRLKLLREHLKLNQAEFGTRIGLKQGGVSWLEQDGNTVTDQNISLVCRTFHVNESWLRDGTGEMLAESEDSAFAAFAEQYKLNEDEQKAARFLLELTSEERQQILSYVKRLAAYMTGGKSFPAPNPPAPADYAATVEQKRAIMEQELAAEAASQGKRSASTGTNGFDDLNVPL